MSSSSVASSPRRAAGATPATATPRTASVFACVVALSNTLLGISVVTVSGAFARAGCGSGTFFLLLFAGTSGCGLHLLARSSLTVSAAERRRKTTEADGDWGSSKATVPASSFRAVALVGAPRWAFLIDFAVALKCFGVGTSYLILVGSLMKTVISGFVEDDSDLAFLLSRRVWVTTGFLLAAPLACSRTVGALRYVATGAIGLVALVAFMVLSFWLIPGLDACPDTLYDERSAVVTTMETSATMTLAAITTDPPVYLSGDFRGFIGDDGSCFEEPNVIGSVRSMLQTLPLFVFCYTCHQNIFSVCNEIVRPTAARIDAVIVGALTVAVSLYLMLCWGSYATFGDGIVADLLDMYPDTGLLTAARISVSMLVITCYPLQVHPCRLCILSALKPPERSSEKMDDGIVYDQVVAGPINDVDEETSGLSTGEGNADDRSVGNLPGANGRGGSLSSPDVAAGRATSKRWGGGEESTGEEGVGQESNPVTASGRGISIERTGLLSGSPLGLSSDARFVGGGNAIADEEGGDDSFPRTTRNRSRGCSQNRSSQREEVKLTSFWNTPEGARHIAVTAGILLLSYAIAMTVDDLGLVLEVVGATGSTTIAFILPGLLYLKVHPEPHPKRSLAAMQLVAGLLIIPVALTSIALGG